MGIGQDGHSHVVRRSVGYQQQEALEPHEQLHRQNERNSGIMENEPQSRIDNGILVNAYTCPSKLS